ncbi:MAG: bifunctional DNA-binding transcriptional regulator/O6-methylguanine-DNA methyltransferase Ada [Reyranellaceae bacterium]
MRPDRHSDLASLPPAPAPGAPVFADDTARWQAVRRRDRGADGAFVFAVRTTGVYCRPSCASRSAKRANVEFFAAAPEAEKAGYRPCKRCRPDGLAGGRRLVERACKLLTAGEEPPPLSQVAAALKLSPSALTRLFQRELGISPRDYLAQAKRGRFRAALRNGEDIAAATFGAGYGSSSRVYEGERAGLGMTPATYRKGGLGARIDYAIAPSPLGKLLVAATPRGVCAVFLGDSEALLQAELRQDFPAATIARDEAALKPRLQAVLARLEGRKRTAIAARDLPLDIRATAFQWQVWQALTEIPEGQTRTYGEIAAALGHPKAARAVGRACATNPVSIVVPCHRAVGSTGSLTGYRWGLKRKRTLLEREKARAGS